MSEKKIFRIGHDCDGWLADSYIPVTRAVGNALGIVIRKEKITGWDAIYRIVLARTGDKDLAKKLEANWFDPELLKCSPANTSAIELFKLCQTLADTEQFVITTRVPEFYSTTKEWLENKLPGVDWENNLQIRRKGDTRSGDKFKSDKIHELRINIMHDDNTQTVEWIAAEAPQCRISYVNQPWNERDLDRNRCLMRIPFDDSKIAFDRIMAVRDEFLEK